MSSPIGHYSHAIYAALRQGVARGRHLSKRGAAPSALYLVEVIRGHIAFGRLLALPLLRWFSTGVIGTRYGLSFDIDMRPPRVYGPGGRSSNPVVQC